MASKPIDIERAIDGPETTVSVFNGCSDGTTVEMWTIVGAAEFPAINERFTPAVLDFFEAHPKP